MQELQNKEVVNSDNITKIKLSELCDLAMNMQNFSNIASMTHRDVIKVVLETLVYAIQTSTKLKGNMVSKNDVYHEIIRITTELSQGVERVKVDLNS